MFVRIFYRNSVNPPPRRVHISSLIAHNFSPGFMTRNRKHEILGWNEFMYNGRLQRN